MKKPRPQRGAGHGNQMGETAFNLPGGSSLVRHRGLFYRGVLSPLFLACCSSSSAYSRSICSSRLLTKRFTSGL